jgi:hypothetical protein
MKEFREFLHYQKEIGEPLFFLKPTASLTEYADATKINIFLKFSNPNTIIWYAFK